MKVVSDRLLEIVGSAEMRLRQCNEEMAREPVLPGGWSRKQVVGHLIDSASNNHNRFVRAALSDALVFPEYDTNGWSAVENPQAAPWELLVSLWATYNRYLAHVIAQIPASKLDIHCAIGSHEGPLRFIIEDYVRHLNHHLGQIL